jgi:hypothetical protein
VHLDHASGLLSDWQAPHWAGSSHAPYYTGALRQSHLKPTHAPYLIGTPGLPWGSVEITAWLSRQAVPRSYDVDVCRTIHSWRDRFEIVRYGRLDHDPGRYPLFALIEFQHAVISAVAKVTRIAPADAGGTIIGSPASSAG